VFRATPPILADQRPGFLETRLGENSRFVAGRLAKP